MMKLNKFLNWCYKTANDEREFLVREKKSRLRQRALNLHVLNSQITGCSCAITEVMALRVCD